MWWRRLGAVVVAAVLVGGALALRASLDDDGTSDGAPTRIVCVSELADACRAAAEGMDDVELSIADARDTLDALATTTDDAPVWVTLDPFPAMLDTTRTTAGRDALFPAATSVASSDITVTVPDERVDVLRAHCTGEALWRCIGSASGEPWADIGGEPGWGSVLPGIAPADRSALGLLTFAEAVGGYLGDTSYSRTRWEAEPGFLPWVRRLTSAVPTEVIGDRSPLAVMLTRPSALNIAAATAAEVASAGATADRVASEYPAPMVRADVIVAATSPDAAPSRFVDRLGDALTDAGWARPASGPSGAPSSGTMLALRDLWEQLT
jgi:hypothetical protein